MAVNSWQKILIEFRALGGVAENVDLRKGPYGRGIFPLDPELPSKIQVPEDLLINAKYLHIDSKEIKINPQSRSAKLRYGIKLNNNSNFSELSKKFSHLLEVENLVNNI